ncbi:MAG: glutathione peroxidase [Saprospiraceae bacterium]
MKPIFFFLLMLLTSIASAQSKSFYDFTAKDIDGKEVKMSDFKGKKVLVVNVASECSNTPQYAVLQKMYENYGGDHFAIIGFPANDFGQQEPGSNDIIREFCTSTYHVTFPIMSKISVSGNDMDPLYKWLTSKSENGVLNAPITWNFQKFMIDENGKLVDFVVPKVSPDCDKIMNWISK